jgi:hypothetical protein
MSRILVVQPHKMLQHAFSVALFPEHQVKVVERIPDAAALKDVDLVIVDALALRQRDSLAQQELSEIQNWKTPTIWIDKDADSQVPTRAKLVLLQAPSGKELLVRAMAECLGAPGTEKQAVNPIRSDAAGPASTTGTAKPQGATASSKTEESFIELVEVVEEGSASERSIAPQKKTK